MFTFLRLRRRRFRIVCVIVVVVVACRRVSHVEAAGLYKFVLVEASVACAALVGWIVYE